MGLAGALNLIAWSAIQQLSARVLFPAYAEVARPTADLIVPTLSEHTMGQLMQLLMLATVVEGRLMGVNPYSEQGTEPSRRGAM